MSDLIDRQAAIDEVQYEIELINHALDSLTLDYNTREKLRQRKGEAREILNSIETLPSVDAVPVVRCKECVNHRYQNGVPYCMAIDYGYGWKDDDFCSRGERRKK